MKALVEATPISGPAWIGKTKSEDLAIELSITLTIEQVFTLFFLHRSRAANVSAVSPDCDTKTYKFSLFNLIFLYLNSDAISISIAILVSSSNQYFAVAQEWYAVPHPIKTIFWIFLGLIGNYVGLYLFLIDQRIL